MLLIKLNQKSKERNDKICVQTRKNISTKKKSQKKIRSQQENIVGVGHVLKHSLRRLDDIFY